MYTLETMRNERLWRLFYSSLVFFVVFQVVDCFVGVQISPAAIFTKSTTVKLLVTLTNTTAARVKGIEVKCSIREAIACNPNNTNMENAQETMKCLEISEANASHYSASNTSEMQSEHPSPSLTAFTPTSITGNNTKSISWHPEEKTLAFVETITRLLTLSRNEHRAARVLEKMVVECFVSGGHPQALARVIVTADVRPSLNIDWLSAHATTEERRYEKPAYEQIAPCPCDVSETSCDVDCCCDSDCNRQQIDVFNCSMDDDSKTTERKLHGCFLHIDSNEYWFPFVCVHATNSPYLGHYYPLAPITRTYSPLPRHHIGYLPKFSNSGKYSKGRRLKIGESVPGLTFAARVFNDKCTFEAPIGFLKDSRTTCTLRASSRDCVKGSLLDTGRHVKSLKSGQWNITVICKRNTLLQVYCDEADIIWDNRTKTCKNMVTGVSVVFQWSDGLIDKVIATLMVEDMVPDGARLRANYAVRFEHRNKKAEDILRSTVARKPWYTLRSPIILGNSNGPDPSLASRPMDLKVLRMLQQDDNGECSVDPGQAVEFGVDSFSGCFLHFLEEDTKSCDILRRKTLAHACSLVPPSTRTSIMMTKVMMMMMTSQEGNPNVTSWPDFIPVLRLDACTNLTIEDHSRANGPSPSSCSNVTTHLEVTIIYKPLDASSTQTSGTRLNLFAVLGATIRTSNSHWRRNNGSMGVEKILLTSSLMFVQVGENGSTNKRFWLTQDSLPCSQDCCWAEALGPAEQTASTTVQMALLSALMALSAFYLARGCN